MAPVEGVDQLIDLAKNRRIHKVIKRFRLRIRAPADPRRGAVVGGPAALASPEVVPAGDDPTGWGPSAQRLLNCARHRFELRWWDDARVSDEADHCWQSGRPAGSKVHIRYPVDTNPDDATWLAAIASRHHGELADYVMESAPVQRFAWFESTSDAHAFVEELADSGRWLASIIG